MMMGRSKDQILLYCNHQTNGFVSRLLTYAQKLKEARLRTNRDDAKSVTQ